MARSRAWRRALDRVLAVAEDARLLRWTKRGSIILNPSNTSHPNHQAAAAPHELEAGAAAGDTPIPGMLPRYAFRDPTTPWLDECVPGEPRRCFFVLVGSGNVGATMDFSTFAEV